MAPQKPHSQKKRQTWSKESMRKDIEDVRAKIMGTLKASKLYQVPRTTLRRLAGTEQPAEVFSPNRIFNVDETGISVVPSQMLQVLSQKGKRRIGALTSAERGSLITCVICMSAGGSFVPPMIIFSRKQSHPLLIKGAPPGAINECHPLGWIQANTFTKWFQHFLEHVKPTEESPVLLILV